MIKNASTHILLVGSGRLAKHLHHWHTLHTQTQTQLFTWDRHQDPHLIKKYLLETQIVWLAISDSAIVPFYEKYLQGYDCKVVHFSGALQDQRLISAHPLMSFTEDLYTSEFYDSIYFALTGTENLQNVLPGFNNSFFILASEQKALYHAYCVMAGNFPQMLWSTIFKDCETNKIPTVAFVPYLKKITENFSSHGETALTGPFVRKDHSTLEKNLAALSSNSSSGSKTLKNIYQTFLAEYFK